jgi:hypothetical protein
MSEWDGKTKTKRDITHESINMKTIYSYLHINTFLKNVEPVLCEANTVTMEGTVVSLAPPANEKVGEVEECRAFILAIKLEAAACDDWSACGEAAAAATTLLVDEVLKDGINT